MQALRIHSHGDPSVLCLDDVERPKPGPGEVLVKILAVSVNHLDLWVRRGMPGVNIPLPRILGSDGTGEICELGEGVTGLAKGAVVMIEPGMSSGRSAMDLLGKDHLSDDYGIRGEHSDGIDCEYACIEARYLRPLPAGLDPVQAAACPLVFLTAWCMLKERAMLRSDDVLLVLGAASGVGSAAVQIAKDHGAKVIATAGSDAKRALVSDLGADLVLDHYDSDWPKHVLSETGGRGVNVVFEHTGPATWKGSMRCLARNGRLVTCGGTTGAEVSLVLPHLFMKNISILGSTMGPRRTFDPILERLASGVFKPVIDQVLPLSEASMAHERLEAGDVVGKIVLVPGS